MGQGKASVRGLQRLGEARFERAEIKGTLEFHELREGKSFLFRVEVIAVRATAQLQVQYSPGANLVADAFKAVPELVEAIKAAG